MQIYTIGHSNHKLNTFLEMLKVHNIKLLADIRTMPRSRFNPHFNSETLAKSLKEEGIEYIHIKALGGFRKPRKDSENLGWESESFRGYADYTKTEEYQSALNDLITMAKEKTTAYMCAEKDPVNCHRRIVSDSMLAKDIKVMHILAAGKFSPHQLTDFARINKGIVTYHLPLFS